MPNAELKKSLLKTKTRKSKHEIINKLNNKSELENKKQCIASNETSLTEQ